jgi:hypothetical protein
MFRLDPVQPITKLLALFGRTEARDFADVYVLAERSGKVRLQLRKGDCRQQHRVGVTIVPCLGT